MHTGEKQFLCLVCNPQDLVWRAVVAWRQKREALIRNKTSRFSASLGLVGIQKRPCSKKTPWSTQFPQLPPPRKAVRLNERTKMGYISPSRAVVMCSAVCFLAGDSSLIRINTWSLQCHGKLCWHFYALQFAAHSEPPGAGWAENQSAG